MRRSSSRGGGEEDSISLGDYTRTAGKRLCRPVFYAYYLVQNQTRVSRYVHHSKCSNNAAPTSTFDIPYSTMKLSCIVFIHTLNIYITKPPPTLPLLLPPPLPDRHSNTIRSNILMTVYAPPTAAQTPVKNCVHPRRTSSNSTCKALTS